MSLEVRQERTGWRDESISKRHRKWGFNCPAVDIDFLVVEYDKGKPIALIEYKSWHAKKPDRLHSTYRALRDFCDKYQDGPLPFFIVRYWSDIWAFCITLGNNCAGKYSHENKVFTERQFVHLLYRLRGHVLMYDIAKELNTLLPEKEIAQW